MKIVHLVVDDKFIDRAIREFDTLHPGSHEFVILDAVPPFRYIRSERVRSVSREGFARAVADDEVSGVVFHCLPPEHYASLRDVPAGKTVVWIGWGYDYYGLLNDAFPNGLLLPATARLVGQLSPRSAAAVPGILRASELSVARPYPKPTLQDIRALQRVDFFSPVIEDEYHLVRRHNPWFKAQYLRWNYGTMEDDMVIGPPPVDGPGPNVLVGNSAFATNNHLEAFDLIRRQVDLKGRKVVVPLSYGDARYASLVSQAGQQLFGSAFLPLTTFMARESYVQLLQSCGLVLMNPLRQQGVGNLMISGLLGARLFVNRVSPVYGWLQRLGIEVADIERLDTAPLTPGQRAGQRAAIEGFGARAVRRHQTQRLVEVIVGCTAAAQGERDAA